MSNVHHSCDVLIVGAGPGGIAAAVTAAELGLRVGVVDEAEFAGGQIWRNRGGSHLPRLARRWLNRLRGVERSITKFRQSQIVARPGPATLLAETPDGPVRLTWRSLVLATGARELFLPFPGWTLPGVVGAGGIQALVKQGLPVAGKRIVVAGSGPLLLAVADLLRAGGARVPMILEQASAGSVRRFARSLIGSPSKLLSAAALRGRLIRTRYLTDAYPIGVERTDGALRVTYRDCRRDTTVECDYLACGFGLVPNNELARLLGCGVDSHGFARVDERQRTTVPYVFAVGELTGIGGVEKAIVEGRTAACVIAGDEAAIEHLSRERAASRAFVSRLDTAFALRPELTALCRPDTIVCRCEDARWSEIAASPSARAAKLLTRCGMGACQGRVCGPILERLLRFEPPQVRPPIFASTIATLAAAGRPDFEECR